MHRKFWSDIYINIWFNIIYNYYRCCCCCCDWTYLSCRDSRRIEWLRWLQYYPLFIWFEHNSFSIFVHNKKYRIHGSAPPPSHTRNPNPSSRRRHLFFLITFACHRLSIAWNEYLGIFGSPFIFCCCCFASAKWNIRIGRLRTQTHTHTHLYMRHHHYELYYHINRINVCVNSH